MASVIILLLLCCIKWDNCHFIYWPSTNKRRNLRQILGKVKFTVWCFFLTIIRLSQYKDGLQFNLKFVRESIADSYLLIIWRHQRHVSYWYYLTGLLENTTKTKGYSLYLDETKYMLLAVKTSQCTDIMYTLLISLYLAF